MNPTQKPLREAVMLTISLLLILGTLAAVVSVGAAQEAPGNETAEPVEQEPAETIDNNTRMVSAEYDHDTGKVTLVLESDSLQRVTISDAGGFQTGGVIEQRTVTLTPDSRTTIKIPVTKSDDGYVGVSISTEEVLYAVPIEAPANLNPFGRVPPMAGWLGGASAMVLSFGGAGLYVRRKQPDSPEVME